MFGEWISGAEVKMLLGMLASRIRVPGFKYQALLLIWLCTDVHAERQQVMAQAVGSATHEGNPH